MARGWMVLALVVPGCGRFAFDPIADAAPDVATDAPVLIRCLDDNFADGNAADWSVVEPAWAVVGGTGPDGSPAFAAQNGNANTLTHLALRDLVAATIALDWRTESAGSGDFIVQLMDVGWVTKDDPRYSVGLFPPGSDSVPDHIQVDVPASFLVLDQSASITPASTWHHLDITFAPDHAITVEIDQAPHLVSGADAMLAGPFDITFGFWSPGFIDNVVVDCAR